MNDGELYRKYQGDLLRYATALVGPDRADDVVSTVVVRTLARRSLSDLDRPKAYLMKGVLNEARGLSRRLERRRGVALWARPAVPERSERPELMEVADAVMQLPVRQRAAVYLFYWEQLCVAETADLMGVRPGTVKRYLHLARRKLEAVLS